MKCEAEDTQVLGGQPITNSHATTKCNVPLWQIAIQSFSSISWIIQNSHTVPGFSKKQENVALNYHQDRK